MRNSRTTLIRPVGLPGGVSTPVVTPLSPSVVFASETPDMLDAQYEGREEGYTYAREGHPNATVLAERIADLEGAGHSIVTGSGMAAVSAALMGVLKSGDHIIGGDQLYGRSLRMMGGDLPRFGIETSLVDVTDAACVEEAIRDNTRMVLIELVSNPGLRVADLVGIAKLCKDRGILLAVDNTFTTPRALRPFEYGADIVLHSVTKLLAGHSDVTLGWISARDADIMQQIEVFAVTTGLTASPFDCWLAERGLATFDLRFDKAQANAVALAAHLGGLKGVKRVLYPMRADHPDQAQARALFGDNGCNMVSFELHGGRAEANAFARACEGISFAPTLGDVGTTLSHPATSSHRALTQEARAALGLGEGFFRVSVGLEDSDALNAVFTQGAEAAASV